MLRWEGESGTTFFPQYSSSLAQWKYFNELYFGEDEHLGTFEEEAAWQFFRICSIKIPVVSSEEALLADFDQDGLSNGDEIGSVGSDPLLADSDGDGLPDGWEHVHQLNVLDDGTLDPLRGPNANFAGLTEMIQRGDGLRPSDVNHTTLSNLAAYQLGVQAYRDADPGDLDGDGLANEKDADPESRAISWGKRDWPTQFAFLDLAGWDLVDHGYVRSINNQGEVLADKAVYSDGAWVELAGIRSSNEGPATPLSHEFIINGRAHPAGLLSLPRAQYLSDEGVIMGNGRVAVLPLSVEDPETGEITVYNSGARPEFVFVWSNPNAEPEILGRNAAEPIEGGSHKETAAMGRDGSVAFLQKQFEEGVPFSNDYRMILTDPLGGLRISDVLSSPGLPKKVEAGAAVAFGTFSYPPATYRAWTWIPGGSQPSTLWSGWQLHGDAPPDHQFPEVIGRLPGGSVCISVSGRTFTQQSGRWQEVPGLEGARFVSPSGMIVIARPGESTAIWNGDEEVSLIDLAGGDEGDGATFIVEDLNDEGVALVRLIATGAVERPGLLVPAEMVPDYNRDGRIDEMDRGKVHPGNPWRWWVNDDDDYHEDEGGDVPDAALPDGMNDQVDGMRDLIDFFPLHLDLRKLLKVMPAEDFEYRLCHDGGGFNLISFAAADLIPQASSLTVNAHITSIIRGKGMERQAIKRVDETGAQLSNQFLSRAEEGEGVVLLEARSASSKPLRLEVRKDGLVKATVEFPILTSGVESMFRHVDMTGLPRNYDGSVPNVDPDGGLTRTADPGDPYPDDLTNGKYFVFLHGFNVSPKKARGWHAEVFKRLHQMGSRARFVGVTWNGDTGIPGLIPDFVTTDYHKAAYFALQTGDALPSALQFTDGADVTVAAHSLGNMVVSQAIEDAGLTPARYYLINGAVAREAYSLDSIPYSERQAMTELEWKPFDDVGLQRLFAANWYKEFEEDPDDSRGLLTWKGRFKFVADLENAHNFYSPGDDVVQNPEVSSAAVWLALWLNGNLIRGTWAAQEFVKGGTSLASIAQSRVQAGWGFNFHPPNVTLTGIVDGIAHFETDVPISVQQGYWKFDLIPTDYSRKYTPNEAMDEISVELQKTKPFFEPFLNSNVFDPIVGPDSVSDSIEQYDILASGIPAMSYAVAVNEVPDLAGNYNMHSMRTDPAQWPLRGEVGNEYENDWLHSDFRDVAMNYLYKMYEKMIDVGDLDS